MEAVQSILMKKEINGMQKFDGVIKMEKNIEKIFWTKENYCKE